MHNISFILQKSFNNQLYLSISIINSKNRIQQQPQRMIKTQQSITSSFVSSQNAQPHSNSIFKWARNLDFFKFMPVPIDSSVSTKRSICGSLIFIIGFVLYVCWDFYSFFVNNPPLIQNKLTSLDNEYYRLPKFAITFMRGQDLNQTEDYSKYIKFGMTKQIKDKKVQHKTPINLTVNNYTYLRSFLTPEDIQYSPYLLSPIEDNLEAKGIIYSTKNSTFTKILITMCNISQPNNSCQDYDNIRHFAAEGRVFLFIEQDLLDQNYQGNKYRVANFFLVPHLYKRVTIQLQVTKTTTKPDYFKTWKTKEQTKLHITEISEVVSNTSANDQTLQRESVEMLGIVFLLNPSTLVININYATFVDHLAKWSAFFNFLFGLFALYFLAYNRNKFYRRNPMWEHFNNTLATQKGNINHISFKEGQTKFNQ